MEGFGRGYFFVLVGDVKLVVEWKGVWMVKEFFDFINVVLLGSLVVERDNKVVFISYK